MIACDDCGSRGLPADFGISWDDIDMHFCSAAHRDHYIDHAPRGYAVVAAERRDEDARAANPR